jgi:hypothetical protein
VLTSQARTGLVTQVRRNYDLVVEDERVERRTPEIGNYMTGQIMQFSRAGPDVGSSRQPWGRSGGKIPNDHKAALDYVPKNMMRSSSITQLSTVF